MPKRHRDFQKRRLGYVFDCLDRAIGHALELRSEFDESLGLDLTSETYDADLAALVDTNSHAKYALLLTLGLKQTLQAQETFKSFALHAWGAIPANVDKWTNTGQNYDRDHKDG